MLVKIGDCFVEPSEIAMVVDSYDSHTEVQPMICIHLRCGSSHWIHSTMDEAEAALIDAGVIENPYPEVPTLTDGEAEALQELYDEGYKWVARGVDGKLFATVQEPKFSAFWDIRSDNLPPKSVEVPFDFITTDDAKPWSIPYLLLDA